jgi:hypothetical protein
MRLVWPALWAAFGGDLPKENRSFGKLPSLLFRDVLLILGVGVGLMAILALSVYGWTRWRRQRRRHVDGGEKVFRGSGQESPQASDSEADEAESESEASHGDHHHQGRRRYKYRVRRRTHRSRNPTLSDTGGLPPVKSQEPSKP